MDRYQHHEQPFDPVFDRDSRILILGSFPSVKSRENNFYYGHPQNRFWRVLSGIFVEELPSTVEEKKKFLLGHGIAVWDVIQSCDIIGSSDNSVKNSVVAKIPWLLAETKIEKIYVNGTLAKKLYNRYLAGIIGIEGIKLPSTSPANARYNLERLMDQWKVICKEDC